MRERNPIALLRNAVVYEIGMWRSLYRWLLRRPPTREPGAEVFGYVGVVKPILIAFIVLSAVEIPIFDVILAHTLPSARKIVLALGVWGLLWMVGLFASLRVHPHVAEAAGLRVRNGFSVDFLVPWAAIASADARYRSLPSSRAVQVEHGDSGPILNVAAAKQTSVDLVLREPLSVRLPKGPSEPVREIRLYADDPAALVDHARRQLAAHAAGAGT
ncbi:hypothetical protein [Micromonospora sp. 15K316]|uniref:hypothetical protein n=1 Tax=Micromonospora sp. 15K316 TaxID=2530376 RepID=UPI001FB7B6ED|nr:hypothetical protein [Micromonospora sp. 15K316]